MGGIISLWSASTFRVVNNIRCIIIKGFKGLCGGDSEMKEEEEIPPICLDCVNVNDCCRNLIYRCYEEEEKEIQAERSKSAKYPKGKVKINEY